MVWFWSLKVPTCHFYLPFAEVENAVAVRVKPIFEDEAEFYPGH